MSYFDPDPIIYSLSHAKYLRPFEDPTGVDEFFFSFLYEKSEQILNQVRAFAAENHWQTLDRLNTKIVGHKKKDGSIEAEAYIQLRTLLDYRVDDQLFWRLTLTQSDGGIWSVSKAERISKYHLLFRTDAPYAYDPK